MRKKGKPDFFHELCLERKISRRHFLKEGAVLLAGVGTGSLLLSLPTETGEAAPMQEAPASYAYVYPSFGAFAKT